MGISRKKCCGSGITGVEVETNFRGYLLTEQRAFLEPLETAEKRLESERRRKIEPAHESSGLQAGVQILSARLKEFIDSKKQLAAVAGTKRDQVQVVREGRGRSGALSDGRADAFGILKIGSSKNCRPNP
ncbi:MAG: CHASE3 domain-containing protein [Nitrospiraceae bacterium]